eukprot:CAMPEP_0176396712 /NCGR_PEP_ID=MMETSP0126-20121128/44492_1 /TAXON_ID=141414 ORGANISM="Strombidinopsis acuminatum, Strain SPMC142" /NCGR_SAMPLE_ID=MMETSP0126 /ASSEMBLY_ACC=CAM_ASM_000229 /LENGTH=35 /DNA_ID= /DNA_START= /DNA_END= /DNA_ORIENTATION=
MENLHKKETEQKFKETVNTGGGGDDSDDDDMFSTD